MTAAELRQIEGTTRPHVLARTTVRLPSAGWHLPCMACTTAGARCHDHMHLMKLETLVHVPGCITGQSSPVCCSIDVRLTRCLVTLISSVPPQSAAAGAGGAVADQSLHSRYSGEPVSISKQPGDHRTRCSTCEEMLYPKPIPWRWHTPACNMAAVPLYRALQTEHLIAGRSSVFKSACLMSITI